MKVRIHAVDAFENDQLVVRGAVVEQDAAGHDVVTDYVGHGWVSWTHNFFPNAKKPDVRRKMNAKELRAYCEQLILEAAGLLGRAELPAAVKLDKA